jgi:hypothetical protein
VDADLIEQRPIDIACPIDERFVLRLQQGAEDRRQTLANELAKLCLWSWFASERGQRLVDGLADSRERVRQRSIEIEQDVHSGDFR